MLGRVIGDLDACALFSAAGQQMDAEEVAPCRTYETSYNELLSTANSLNEAAQEFSTTIRQKSFSPFIFDFISSLAYLLLLEVPRSSLAHVHAQLGS